MSFGLRRALKKPGKGISKSVRTSVKGAARHPYLTAAALLAFVPASYFAKLGNLLKTPAGAIKGAVAKSALGSVVKGAVSVGSGMMASNMLARQKASAEVPTIEPSEYAVSVYNPEPIPTLNDVSFLDKLFSQEAEATENVITHEDREIPTINFILLPLVLGLIFFGAYRLIKK